MWSLPFHFNQTSSKMVPTPPTTFNSQFQAISPKFQTVIHHLHPSKKLSSGIQKVKENENESFRSYDDRFNAEAIQVDNLNIEMTCKAIKKGSKFKFCGDNFQLMEKA